MDRCVGNIDSKETGQARKAAVCCDLVAPDMGSRLLHDVLDADGLVHRDLPAYVLASERESE
jgi:hypothetical protein